MKRYCLLLAVIAAVFSAVSGCATIAQSTGIGNSVGSDLVAITSKPSGATVHIDGVQVGVTPLTITVSPRAKVITFAKDGYSAVTIPIPKDWNGWAIANVLWIPGVVVDAVTGNIRKVRGTISATLPKAGG
ncbi:MAG: PEGA domain-containing protein [Planctomycetota bacterium]|nr:PEGA domain-containing protein [Planctomycetota bacterium]